MPADHRDRKGDPRGVLLWRQSHADLAAQSIQRALVRLVDQVDWPAAHVLALHAEGVRLVPQTQYEFQGGCGLRVCRGALLYGRRREFGMWGRLCLTLLLQPNDQRDGASVWAAHGSFIGVR